MFKFFRLVTYAKIFGIAATFFLTFSSDAQSSLIGTLPMQFNPAFAGAVGSARIGVGTYLRSMNTPGFSSGNYRYRRSNLAFSFDKFIPKIGSGIKIQGSYTNTFLNDSKLPTTDNTDYFNMGLSFAPKFSFRGKCTLSPAIEISADIKKTNFEHLSQKSELVHTTFSPGTRLGLSFNARKFYIGISYHLNGNIRNYRDVLSFGGLRDFETKSGPHGYLQLGYNFQRREDSKFSFSPQLVLGRSREYTKYRNIESNYLDKYTLLNLNFKFKQVIWAVNWTGYYGIQLMVGWQRKNFKIAYLHSGVRSGLYSGEISLRYILNRENPSNGNKNIDY